MMNTSPNASTAQNGGNKNKPSNNRAPRMQPVITRVLSIRFRRDLGRGLAKAALALAEVLERGLQQRG